MTYTPPQQPVNYETAGPRPGNGLAIAAMVCGLLGLLFMPIGIVGLVLGIVALAKRKHPTEPGKGMAITGVIAGGVSLLMVPMCIAILLPSLSRAREAANRIKCSSNMRQIGLALKMYTNADRTQSYPPDLATLVRDGNLTDPNVFTDPSDDHANPAAGGAPAAWASQITSAPSPNCSYVYPYQPGWTESLPSNVVILYEPLTNHKQDGINVMFADAHVEFVGKVEAQTLVQQIQAGQNPPPVLRGYP